MADSIPLPDRLPEHMSNRGPAPLAAPPAAGVPPRTVLLVEDSRHAAEAVRLIARRLGLRLRRAETLAAARAHLRLYRPDILLIDLGLPDGSGLELIAEAAAAPAAIGRVVALSAEPEGAHGALAAGAHAFLAKPLRLPADVPVLIGMAPPGAPEPPRDALTADPLALRDDLTRAARVLPDARIDYVARFIAGVARCAGDQGLAGAASEALAKGEVEALRVALAERTRTHPAEWI
jgi:CheY-like chemotaxis protein